MNDPHVAALIYKIEHGPSVDYRKAESIDHEEAGFRVKIAKDQVRFEFKEHYATEDAARKAIEDYIRAWEFGAGLENGPSCFKLKLVHPVNGEVPPVKGRPWKLPHYANRGKTSSSGGELASARSCFSTVRTALGKLRITGLLARFDVARSFPQFPRPLLLQPTIWTSERGADLGSGRCQPRPHLPIYRMTPKV